MDPIQSAHELPVLTRTEGTLLVLEALRKTYEEIPADQPTEQTARMLAVLLRGDVDVVDFNHAFDLWILRNQIADPNGDLEYLLDLPNTDANRAREVENAQGNLMAAVSAILDKAGCK